jgi:hypothetical protein
MITTWRFRRQTVGPCTEEINHVGNWASSNNLRLNHAKSMKIVFVSPRGRRAVVIPAPAVPDIPMVENIQVLHGVTLSRRFSVSQHVDQLLVACSQSLFALRTLRHHGLYRHTVIQATCSRLEIGVRVTCMVGTYFGWWSWPSWSFPQAVGGPPRFPLDYNSNAERHLLRG